MSGETSVILSDAVASTDEPSIVHTTCCREWLPAGGPTFCGSPVDDPSPVLPIDFDCVVCDDLENADPMMCPRFGRCEDESFT